jgi:catechol 2,3-dioxygenase-like lactoylglutathione lyase family enzyme
MIEFLSAVTLVTTDMRRAVRFYRELGFETCSGGEDASFTSFAVGSSYLNLVLRPAGAPRAWWGRVIFHVTDVDRLYEVALRKGLAVEAAPRNAEWGERYFHVVDPDGHELSFAKLL